MKENILDKIKESISEIANNNEAYTKLIQLKKTYYKHLMNISTKSSKRGK